MAAAVRATPLMYRWDVKGVTGISLYTQVLSLAQGSSHIAASQFPNLVRLSAATAPGGLARSKRFFYRNPLIAMTALTLIPALLFAGILQLLRRYFHQIMDFGASVGVIWMLVFTFTFYYAMFRLTDIRIFYRILVNCPIYTPQLSDGRTSLLLFLPVLILQRRLFPFFLTNKERNALAWISPHWERGSFTPFTPPTPSN